MCLIFRFLRDLLAEQLLEDYLKMARMHSRKKGKSGPNKPVEKHTPTWLRYTAKELELLVVKLAKEGKSPSQIGLALRDSYGVPDVKMIAKKTVSEMLREKKLAGELPEDLQNLIVRSVALQKHIDKNRQDMVSKRGLQLTESKIKRLVKYYKKTGALSSEWKYNPKNARMYAA